MDQNIKKTDAFKMTAVCGIYCGECECHTAKDNPKLMEYLISRGIPKEVLPCEGCRSIEGNCPTIGGICKTYICAKEHDVDFCYECNEFPCAKLNPASDRANILPHNLKVFNLCCIKQRGLDEFVEGYKEVKGKYYQGKMLVGEGPQL